ncbi:MAG: hypothetical protein RL725_68, partial [Actinomycetota bacterium]
MMNQIGIPNLDKSLEASLLADMAKVEELMRSHIKGDYPLVIETSRGRATRPLIVVKEGKSQLTEKHLSQLEKNEISF